MKKRIIYYKNTILYCLFVLLMFIYIYLQFGFLAFTISFEFFVIGSGLFYVLLNDFSNTLEIVSFKVIEPDGDIYTFDNEESTGSE